MPVIEIVGKLLMLSLRYSWETLPRRNPRVSPFAGKLLRVTPAVCFRSKGHFRAGRGWNHRCSPSGDVSVQYIFQLQSIQQLRGNYQSGIQPLEIAVI